MARLQAILFDIDDTLFSTTEFARKARRNAVRAMIQAGLDVPEEVVLKELDEVLAEFSSNCSTTTTSSSSACARRACRPRTPP